VNEHAPIGKLEQMQAHGARVFRVRGFITSPAVTNHVLGCLTRLSADHGLPLVISAYRFCPEGMAGVESLSVELMRQVLPRVDHVFVPIGGGGLFSAICRGFQSSTAHRPRVHAVQPNRCATVIGAFARGESEIRPVESTTRISGLSVPNDIDAGLALDMLRKSGGLGLGVDDEEVFEAQRLILAHEGIYCEPAAAAAVAGLNHAVKAKAVNPKDNIVCIVTGHGFKDPDSIRIAAARHAATLIDPGEIERNIVDVNP
jgi:threonine synthase